MGIIMKKHGEAQAHSSGECPVCGKTFSPAPYHDWYVDGVLVCTYSCQARGEREGYKKRPGKNQKKRGRGASDEIKKRAIDLVLKEGYTYKEAGDAVGYKHNTVGGWVRDYLEEEG
jgi:transposase-like protein